MCELIYLAICFIDAGKAIVIGPKVSIFIIIIITFNHQVSWEIMEMGFRPFKKRDVQWNNWILTIFNG